MLNTPWVDVVDTKGTKVEMAGSLRWKNDNNSLEQHVKGILKLQRRSFATGISAFGGIAFRLCYDGHRSGDPSDAVRGAVTLPSEVGWHITPTKEKTRNGDAKAHVVTLKFPTNEEDLTRLKVTVPFIGNGQAEKLFGEALAFADQQCRAAITANTPKTPRHSNTKKRKLESATQQDDDDQRYTTAEAAAKTPLLKRAKQSNKKSS